MGYLIDGMDEVRYKKDARLAFSMWVQELDEAENIQTEIEYFETAEQIVGSYRSSELDMLVLNPIFYLRHQQTIDPLTKQYWIVQKHLHLFEKSVILVRKESNIKSLSDLKGKRITTRHENYLGRLILEKELLEQVHTGLEGHIKEVIETSRASTALLKTFFGKSDACLVPAYTLRLAKEMNPAIGEMLVPIFESEAVFFPVLVMFHKDSQDAMVNAFEQNIDSMDKSVRGQNINELFKIKKVSKIDHASLQPLKEYYQKYLRLKERYGVKSE